MSVARWCQPRRGIIITPMVQTSVANREGEAVARKLPDLAPSVTSALNTPRVPPTVTVPHGVTIVPETYVANGPPALSGPRALTVPNVTNVLNMPPVRPIVKVPRDVTIMLV